MKRERDKDIIKSITSKRVFEVYKGNKFFILNNAIRFLILLKKEYLLEEVRRKVYDYVY